MKRIVDQQRRPEPLTLYTDADEIESVLDDAITALEEQGYDTAPRYQVGLTLPPVDESEDVQQYLDDSPSFYVLTDASNGDHRRNEQAYPSFEYENLETVTSMMDRIEEAVEAAGYRINFWQIGGVETPYERENVSDHADAMEVQALARLDTEESISVGWFYRAPMDNTMEFGYSAFPDREFRPEDYDDPEESVEAALRRITGQREDERNEHDLDEDELAMLYDIEEALLEHDVL